MDADFGLGRMQRIWLSLLVLVSLLTIDGPAVAQTPSPTPALEPHPFARITIAGLRERNFGQGEFKVEQTLQVTDAFTRTLVSFTSEGLKIYGFMNTPKGKGPFPVVLVLHGHVDPRAYRTPYTYTQRYADWLARQGFLVIHPDYRGHGRSEGEAEGANNLFRVGYAIDVLNLIAYVKKMPDAKPAALGLFGHSMGGGIAIRVLTVSKDVKAAVLYGAMNADEALNVKQITTVFRPGQHIAEEDVPSQYWHDISPVNYLSDISAPVQIHAGASDNQVPPRWSAALAAQLKTLGKRAELFEYPGQGHSLQGQALTTMMARVTAFYRSTLQ